MKNKLSIFAAFCALLALIGASDRVIAACRDGLRLCVDLILPSLFPFFVVSILLGKLGFPALLGEKLGPSAARLFRVSGAGISALFIGLTGGYPMGAAYLAELESSKTVSSEEAQHLLTFCNNSGPAFLIGAVGTAVFSSPQIGLQLYGIHALAAVLTGLLLRNRAPGASLRVQTRPAPPPPFSLALADAVRQAVVSLLGVCGFVLCFTVFTGLLDANGFFSAAARLLAGLPGMTEQSARALLCGFFELGSGVGALRGLPPTPQNLTLAAGILGWGGLSVHFQTLSLLADSEMKGAPHTAGRLLSAALSAAMAYVFFSVF